MLTRPVVVSLVSMLLLGACTTSAGGESSQRSPELSETSRSGKPCGEESPQNLPGWANDYQGFAGRKFVSSQGNVVAVVFTPPLTVSRADQATTNKILWVMRTPRNGDQLRIDATLPGSSRRFSTTQPPDSGPGNIYPTMVNVPAPGCWHMSLSWNGNTDTVDLFYRA